MSRKRFASPVEEFDDDFCEDSSPSGKFHFQYQYQYQYQMFQIVIQVNQL